MCWLSSPARTALSARQTGIVDTWTGDCAEPLTAHEISLFCGCSELLSGAEHYRGCVVGTGHLEGCNLRARHASLAGLGGVRCGDKCRSVCRRSVEQDPAQVHLPRLVDRVGLGIKMLIVERCLKHPAIGGLLIQSNPHGLSVLTRERIRPVTVGVILVGVCGGTSQRPGLRWPGMSGVVCRSDPRSLVGGELFFSPPSPVRCRLMVDRGDPRQKCVRRKH